ncbi:MAG: S41 family peptidase [Pelobium sp.]
MKKSISHTIVFFALITIIFTACKKDKKVTPIPEPPVTSTASRSDLTKDSIFLYAKEVYLWNSSLPTYEVFNPRSYNSPSSHINNLNAELFEITRYGINSATGKPYEFNPDDSTDTKYSYIEDLVASGKLTYVPASASSVGLDGKGNDFGIGNLVAVGTNSGKVVVFFKSIFPSSPAALQGLSRGDYFDTVNGRNISNFTTTGLNNDYDFINDALSSTKTTLTLSGTKKDNTKFDVNLTKSIYNSSPILKDSIYTVNGKKIGYLAFARFSDDKNAEAALNTVFAKFSTANVTDLVIDLRYNGGGYVSTAAHLINLIIPASANGKMMFAETYNSTLQKLKKDNNSILKNQPLKDQQGKIQYKGGKMVTYANYLDEPYTVAENTTLVNKEGSVANAIKAVFITTGNTASASELTINSLKPYMDVKIIGETTYGKPVGFFPIRIDKFDVYISSFSTTNALGEGFYFAGFVPDAIKKDDYRYDFGDVKEDCLKAALSYITTGGYTNSSQGQTVKVNGTSVSNKSITEKNIFNAPSFNGMIAIPKMK